MLCLSCGAPMTLYRQRGYYRCEYCGSYHFPEAAEDGVRLLGTAPEKLPCPVCHEPLLIAQIDDVYEGHQCPQCRGLYLPTKAFGAIVARRRAAMTSPPAPPQPRNMVELERRLACPRCAQKMDTHPYYGPGNIIIDTCNTCHTVWLDSKELARVVDAPGRDRGIDRSQQMAPLRSMMSPAANSAPAESSPSLLEFLSELLR